MVRRYAVCKVMKNVLRMTSVYYRRKNCENAHSAPLVRK